MTTPQRPRVDDVDKRPFKNILSAPECLQEERISVNSELINLDLKLSQSRSRMKNGSEIMKLPQICDGLSSLDRFDRVEGKSVRSLLFFNACCQEESRCTFLVPLCLPRNGKTV